MNKTELILAKNDIEGLASSILLNTTILPDPDINFCKYEADLQHYQTKDYAETYSISLKNTDAINSKTVYVFDKFKDVVEFCKKKNPKIFETNKVLNEFIEHVNAYINWTWKDKQLYWCKNIDELSKYYNKNKLVATITNRIHNEEVLVTDTEIEIIIFSKKMLTSYIENKAYNVMVYDNKKYVCAYATINEIELANKLLNQEKADVAIVINLNNDIVRIKTAKDSSIQEEILNLGGVVNSNGGTFKLSYKHIININHQIFLDIIKSLKGGVCNE